jgi:NADPH2:quinone reductase
VWPLLEQGRVAPIVHAVFPLERAAERTGSWSRASTMGEIVLSYFTSTIDIDE